VTASLTFLFCTEGRMWDTSSVQRVRTPGPVQGDGGDYGGGGDRAMSEVTGIALARNRDGRLELVATTGGAEGFGGDVWHAWQTAPNGSWTGWSRLGRRPGGGASAPAVARNADGRLEVAVVGGDGTVWHRWQTAPNNDWSSQWESFGELGDQRAMAWLVLTRNADGRLEVFVPANNDVGDERAVWHRWQTTPNGTWSKWDSLEEPPGGLFGPLAVGANADGRLELFAPAASSGGNQQIWDRFQRTAGDDDWWKWFSLDTAGSGELLTSVPVVARNADGRLELFVVGGNGAVWHRWQTTPNGKWSSWKSMGSQAGGFADLGVGRNADGRLEVFATLQNGTDLWHVWQTAPNGNWSSWKSMGSVATGTIAGPTLASDADGRLEVFLQTPDTGGLYQLSQSTPNGGWTPGHGWPPPS
jgi:hypothetical protein